MLFCRHGIFVGHGVTAWLVVVSIGIFFLQAPPVSAQDPSVAFETGDLNPLDFETSVFNEVREGYVSLAWNDWPGAVAYRVTDSNGKTVYQGEFSEAFVSGLPDGSHRFSLVALDSGGEPINVVVPIATVHVAHWPMWQAMTSLVIGAVVFVLLIGAIIHGSFASPSRSSGIEDAP